jgi:hypothetical protein
MSEFNPYAPNNPGAFREEPLAPEIDVNALAQEQPPVVETPTPAPVVTVPTPAVSVAPVENVDIHGLKDNNIGGLSLSGDALAVKAKLAREAKMPMFIPFDPGEKPGAFRSVTINGYRCEVKKGKMVSLPMSIAKMLMDSYEIEAEALNNHEDNLQNANEDRRKALGA